MAAHSSSRRSRRPHGWIGAGLALAVLAFIGTEGCGDDGSMGPEIEVPGDLVITLVSPSGPEGAAILETSDSGIVEVTSSSGRAFLGGSGGTTRIVILMPTPGQIELTVRLADTNRPPRLRLVEVADGDNELRPDLSGYTISTRTIETVASDSPEERP